MVVEGWPEVEGPLSGPEPRVNYVTERPEDGREKHAANKASPNLKPEKLMERLKRNSGEPLQARSAFRHIDASL